MSIPLTGTGGLFTQLGVIGAIIYRENLQQSLLNTRFNNLPAQYAAPNNDLIGALMPNTASYAQTPSALVTALTTLASNTVLRQVFLDTPAQSGNLTNALKEVIRQMGVASATVNRCNVTATPAAVSGINGDGVMVATTLTGSGLPLENIVAEALSATCTRDNQSSGATLGNEQFTILGQPIGNDATWYQWPQGSAATGTITAVNALSNATSGNLIYNGGFDTFVSNVPTRWTPTVGTAGTDFVGNSSTYYSGGGSLQLVGNAAGTGVKVAMYEQFNQSITGTSSTLAPTTAYAFSFRIRADVVPAAGVITVSLIGGPTAGSMVQLNDAQGNAAAVTFNVHSLAANNTWYAESGVLRAPAVMPACYAVQVAVTTAISTGSNVYVDHLAMTTLGSLYAGGPFVALFSGATPFIQNDRIILTTTNDRAGSTDGATFQTLFDRLFLTADLGLLLPSSVTPSIADTLITT